MRSRERNVIVPYVRDINPWVRLILDSYDFDVRYVSLDADEDAYRRLLQSVWYEARTVVIVEHDIVPWYGAVEELYDCMGLWCSCSYRYRGGYGVYHGLGCTKISGAVMRQLPTLWDQYGHWSLLDQRLWFAAREIQQEPHPHRPPVLHLNEMQY